MRLVLDLQACQTTGSRHRGIGRYSLSLALAMAEAAGNHELWVALNVGFPDSIHDLRKRLSEYVPAERIAVFGAPRPSAQIDPGNRWRAQAATCIRESFLAGLEPDLVHVSSLFEGLGDDAVASVGAFEGLPTAVTLYDLIPYLYPDAYLGDEPVARWYRSHIEDLKRADLLLAISEHTRQEAIDTLGLSPDRVVNVSGDADPDFRRIELSEADRQRLLTKLGLSRPFVMYTGGVDYRKNLEGMIEAYGRLSPDVRARHQLAIVCSMDSEARQRLTTLGRTSGLADDELVFPGYVTDEELVALYNLCRLFVFPSLYEGFGLPPLEAMRCGAPVLGSSRSSIPEVIRLPEALFDPSSVDGIAATVHRALTDDAFRERLIRNGEEQQARFSWQESGRRAVEAFEALQTGRATAAPAAGARAGRPRLAYVSPLPPERSGIADFSAELLPALAAHYDIELVTELPATSDAWLRENLPTVSVRDFEAGRDRYDRVLYHIGNSSFHAHMPALLARVPGVVVLHDFYISHLIRDLAAQDRTDSSSFAQRLLESHGYPALEFVQAHGEERAVWEYPCSRETIANAVGVIVQSKHARDLVAKWYGPQFVERVREIPFFREVAAGGDRSAARAALGLTSRDFLVCCFGVVGPAKLHQEILDAWDHSPLRDRADCRLVFVGDGASSPYGRELQQRVEERARKSAVSVTGYVEIANYRRHLAAADLAVQLRTRSRGETSAAILDCLAHGVPVIANAHGATAELPDAVVRKIPETAVREELVRALAELSGDPKTREELARRGRDYLATERRPDEIARQYRDAIDGFTRSHPLPRQRRLVRALGDLPDASAVSDRELVEVARCIAENQRGPGERQLLVDISKLVRIDSKSGIQRVVRNTLGQLLRRPFEDLRVEPVYRSGSTYRYARTFCAGLLGFGNAPFDDPPVDVRPNDVFLGLDVDDEIDSAGRAWIRHGAHRGMKTYFVLYDLLPVSHRRHFPPEFVAVFQGWLEGTVRLASGIVCISEAVADELARWVENKPASLGIGHFHLGADIEANLSTRGISDDERGTLGALDGRRFFLMVGTLEPRKRHALVLAALESLWSRGVDAALAIVGRKGWMVDDLARDLRGHPEAGRRLFWMESASDEMLLELYGRAGALIQASDGEGFGLPLIEAAHHGVPVIARDIPVFREVAGEHAFYFRESGPDGLAERLEEWLARREDGDFPTSEGMTWLTWAQSAEQLLDVIRNERWTHRIRLD